MVKSLGSECGLVVKSLGSELYGPGSSPSNVPPRCQARDGRPRLEHHSRNKNMNGSIKFNVSARASPVSDAHRPRLSDATRKLGLPRDGRARLKKRVQTNGIQLLSNNMGHKNQVRLTHELAKRKLQTIQIASLNIGTMTGCGRELAEVLKKRNVHIACVQEVRWKGEKAKDLGAGYKLLYYGTSAAKNGVGVIVNEQLREGP